MTTPRSLPKIVAVLVPVVGIVIVVAFGARRHPAPTSPAGPGSPAEANALASAARPMAPASAPATGDQLPGELVRKLSDLKTRAATARSMGEQKDKRAASYLRAYCSDPDVGVRSNSIWALGEIGDARSGMAISMRTADPESGVRLEAAIALAKLVAEEDPAEAVVSGLTESLKSEEIMTRLAAAKGLAKCKNETGIKVLVDLLGHADPVVRKGAEDGLRGVGDAMVPSLKRALERAGADEATLRNVRLLALFKNRDSAPVMIGVLRAVCQEPQGKAKPKVQPPVRQVCVDALIGLGPDIVPLLDEEVVKGRCPLALKEAGADVLKNFGSAAVEPICRRIISRQIFPEELELKLWVDTLGEIGDPAAAPALSSALTKPVADKELYKRAVDEAVRKIEAKAGRKLTLPPAPDSEGAG